MDRTKIIFFCKLLWRHHLVNSKSNELTIHLNDDFASKKAPGHKTDLCLGDWGQSGQRTVL